MKILFKIWVLFTALLGILAVIGGGVILGSYCMEYHAGSESYIQLSEMVQREEIIADGNQNKIEAPEMQYRIDFDALRKINSDVIGWIIVPDTNINYPIVKRENDNSFYLTHLFDKSQNKAGCIFMDTRCNLGDTHAIIHGHNMGNGTMFRDLNQFKNREFFEKHPYFFILTPKENYVVEIFAGSVVRIDYPVWQLDFSDESDILTWLSDCRASATQSRNMDISPEDEIVTLSTCSYEYSQARWIVQGRVRTFTYTDQEFVPDLFKYNCSLK